jgi:tetratricopeptide (TPR) repeat protein
MRYQQTDRIPESVLRIVDAAADLLEAGQPEKSLALLLDAQQQAPDYVPLLMLLSVVHQQLGQSDKAAAALRRVLKLEPKHPEALLSLGMLFAAQGKHGKALPFLERYLDLNPLSLPGLKAYSRSLIELGRAEESGARLEHAWRASGNPQVGLLLIRHWSDTGQWDKAEPLFSQLVQDATDVDLLEDLAFAFLLKYDAEAGELWRRVVTLSPHSALAWEMLSSQDGIFGRDAEALETARRALNANPDRPWSWSLLSARLRTAHQVEEALQVARTGLALPATGESEDAFDRQFLALNEAEALAALGETEAALARAQEVRCENPLIGGALALEIRLLIALNRPEEALKAFDEAPAEVVANEVPYYWTSLRYLALHLLGRGDEALRVIEPAGPKDIGVIADAAIDTYRSGRIDIALAIFEQLHSLAPYQLRPRIGIGFVRTGLGELQRARAQLERALEMADQDEMHCLILAHLAYLELVAGQLPRARRWLREAGLLHADSGNALLRTAYWWNGAVEADSNPFPTDALPVRCANGVNLVAAQLASGATDQALATATGLAQEYPSEARVHRALGCARWAAGDAEGAVTAWRDARELADNDADRQAIDRWLQDAFGRAGEPPTSG